MAMHFRRLIISLLFCACATAPRPKAESPEAEAGQAPATAKARNGDGADAVRMDDLQLTYTFDEQGGVTAIVDETYELLSNEPPAQFAEVSMAFRPWYQSAPKLEATVTTPDGKVLTLDPRTIAEGPLAGTPEQFSDAKLLRAPLPALTRGAKVHVRLERHDVKALLDGSGRLLRIPLAWPMAIGHAKITIDVPASLPLKHELVALPGAARVEKKNGRTVLEYEASKLPAFEAPANGFPRESVKYPSLFVSTAGDWAQVAKAYGKVATPPALSPTLTAKAKELTAKAKTPEEKANALLEWMHRNVRYTSIELGDGSIVPRTPDETVSRGYGDCKDMSVLLVSMLRAAGVGAQIALLEASQLPDLIDLPGFGEFNHVITRLDGKKPVWVDPTFPFGAAGFLPSLDQGRRALLINDGKLETTPYLASSENRRVVRYEYVLPQYGNAKVKRIEQTTGVGFIWGRSLALQDDQRYQQDMEKAWRRIYASKSDVKLSHSDPVVLGAPFQQTVETETEQAGTWERDAAVNFALSAALEGFPLQPEQDEAGKPKKREEPMEWGVPHQAIFEWVITPAPGFGPRELPAPVDLKAGPAHLTASYTAAPSGVVTVKVMFDTGARVYSAADVEAAREGLKNALDQLPGQLVFDNRVSMMLEKGQVKDALALARSLVEQQPASAPVRLYLARALASARAYDRARAEAKKSIELDPKSANGHRLYGDLLRRDTVGQFTDSAKHADVAAELAEAYRLEPDERLNAEYAAQMFEYDDAWEWYGAKAQLPKARAIYEAWREKHDDGYFDGSYARLLFRMREHETLVKLAPKLHSSAELNALYVASVAVTKGAGEAFTAARREIGDAKAFAAAVASAYARLLEVREYEKGRDLLYRAAKLGGTEAQLARFKVVLDRLQKQPKAPATDAKGTVIEMFRTVFEQNSKGFAAMIEPSLDPKELESLMAMRGMRAQLSEAFGVESLNTDAIMDIFISSPQWSVEKLDGIGELVTAADELKGSAHHFVVVTSGGKRKVHAGSFLPSQLAAEAFARSMKGDTAGANRWLELTRRLKGVPEGAGQKLLEKIGEPDATKVAAAALMLKNKDLAPEKPLEVIEAAFQAETKPKRRELLRQVLSYAYMIHERPAPLLALADDFAKTEDDDQADFFRYQALMKLQKFDEARLHALKVAGKKAGDTEWLGHAAWSAAKGKRFDEARTLLDQVLAKKGDDATALNNAAWYALFDRVDDKAIQRAERANAVGGEQDAYLGTLVCLYAHAGRVDDALRIMGKMIDRADDFEQGHSSRWYAMGRIAEGLGLNDEARKSYARVDHGEDAQDDLWPLANERLAALGNGRVADGLVAESAGSNGKPVANVKAPKGKPVAAPVKKAKKK